MGVLVDDTNVFMLHHADDQVLLGEDEVDALFIISKSGEEFRKWSLSMNINKTWYFAVGGDEWLP